MAYCAEVVEMRMDSGGIGQDGGRGSKSDGEICIRVVVILDVGRCHDFSDLDCERLTDTRAQRGRHAVGESTTWNNNDKTQSVALAIYRLRQFFRLSSFFLSISSTIPSSFLQSHLQNVNVLWTLGSHVNPA